MPHEKVKAQKSSEKLLRKCEGLRNKSQVSKLGSANNEFKQQENKIAEPTRNDLHKPVEFEKCEFEKALNRH